MESLHPRVRIVWLLIGLLGAVVVGLLVAVADRFLLSIGWWLSVAGLWPAAIDASLLPVVTFVVILVCAVPYSLARYRVWQFEIRDDALHLERGVITRVETAVPFVRIQHVDTQRGPVERLFGLSSVVVYTAGSRGADVTIPGLRSERASAIHNQLRELAIESEEDAV